MNGCIRVVDTAPLIFLAKLRRLELLQLGVDDVYVPSSVLDELSMVQDDANRAVQGILGKWLLEKACTQLSVFAMAAQFVDRGEAEVIALAIELGTKHVVLDDLDARRFAVRNGLQPIGTLDLLLAAKGNGIIDVVAPEIEALLKAGFRASGVLVERVLAEAGE